MEHVAQDCHKSKSSQEREKRVYDTNIMHKKRDFKYTTSPYPSAWGLWGESTTGGREEQLLGRSRSVVSNRGLELD
jgi:hypothetical protein